MLRRSAASPFAPGAYVFPGGTLDENDSSEKTLAHCVGLDGERISRELRARAITTVPADIVLPTPAQAAGLYVAALRELYEEAGILLACDRDGNVVPSPNDPVARNRSFMELLHERSLFADARTLAFFSHWITPPAESRRFSAHFFVAKAWPEAIGAADAFETHDEIWIAPQDALDRFAAGSFKLMYPTVKHLERLTIFSDADALLRFAREKRVSSIMPDTPVAGGYAIAPQLERKW